MQLAQKGVQSFPLKEKIYKKKKKGGCCWYYDILIFLRGVLGKKYFNYGIA